MERTDEETNEEAAQPDQQVDRQLLSPGRSDIFTLHATQPSDEEIGDIEGEHPDQEHPSLATPADGQVIHLLQPSIMIDIRHLKCRPETCSSN